MNTKQPEEAALEVRVSEFSQYDADIDALKNFMQNLGDKNSLEKFFIQQGVISFYKQLREEIAPPRPVEDAWRRIQVTDTCDEENSFEYKVSSEDTDSYE